MFTGDAQSGVILIAAFIIFLLVSAGVIAILWIALPFSVFGLKALIKEALEEVRKTNEFLKRLTQAVERIEADKKRASQQSLTSKPPGERE